MAPNLQRQDEISCYLPWLHHNRQTRKCRLELHVECAYETHQVHKSHVGPLSAWWTNLAIIRKSVLFYNKHHAAENWCLKVKFQIPPLRSVTTPKIWVSFQNFEWVFKFWVSFKSNNTIFPNTTDLQWILARILNFLSTNLEESGINYEIPRCYSDWLTLIILHQNLLELPSPQTMVYFFAGLVNFLSIKALFLILHHISQMHYFEFYSMI